MSLRIDEPERFTFVCTAGLGAAAAPEGEFAALPCIRLVRQPSDS